MSKDSSNKAKAKKASGGLAAAAAGAHTESVVWKKSDLDIQNAEETIEEGDPMLLCKKWHFVLKMAQIKNRLVI